MRGERAYGDLATLNVDAAETVDPLDINEMLGPQELLPHKEHQRRAACQNLAVVRVPRYELARFLYGSRLVILAHRAFSSRGTAPSASASFCFNAHSTFSGVIGKLLMRTPTAS